MYFLCRNASCVIGMCPQKCGRRLIRVVGGFIIVYKVDDFKINNTIE